MKLDGMTENVLKKQTDKDPVLFSLKNQMFRN